MNTDSWIRNRALGNLAVCVCALLSLAGCQDKASTAAPGALGPTSAATPNGDSMNTRTAMFGAGCFWGVEAAFRHLPGVIDTSVGFAGGKTSSPSYEQVCTHTTGHAEVVRVVYDPAKISYDQLLDVFWKCHDPTQLNRQGPDVGDQYRSVIFTDSPEQAQAAEASLKRLADSGKYKRPVVTVIEPAPTFYLAEEYHQHYLEKRGLDTCHVPGPD